MVSRIYGVQLNEYNMCRIAVDVWSAGMILLFFLIGKFPLFQSNDDIEALMEIAVIIGRKSMEKVATLHRMYRWVDNPKDHLAKYELVYPLYRPNFCE